MFWNELLHHYSIAASCSFSYTNQVTAAKSARVQKLETRGLGHGFFFILFFCTDSGFFIGAHLVSENDSFYNVKGKNNTCESHPLSTPCTSHEYLSNPQTPSHHSSSSSGTPSPPPRVPSISATRERRGPSRFPFLTLGIYVHDFSCFFLIALDPSCPSACLSSSRSPWLKILQGCKILALSALCCTR